MPVCRKRLKQSLPCSGFSISPGKAHAPGKGVYQGPFNQPGVWPPHFPGMGVEEAQGVLGRAGPSGAPRPGRNA